MKRRRILRRHIPDLDEPPSLRRFRHDPANVPHGLAKLRHLLRNRHRANHRIARRQRLQPELARLDFLDPEVVLNFATVPGRGGFIQVGIEEGGEGMNVEPRSYRRERVKGIRAAEALRNEKCPPGVGPARRRAGQGFGDCRPRALRPRGCNPSRNKARQRQD
jgi:hypothetical protein